MLEFVIKEEAYERTYNAGKHAENLYKYMPRKVLDGVIDAFSDSDGYWIYLSDHYTAYDGGSDCRIIHEHTVQDLKAAIKTIRKEERA